MSAFTSSRFTITQVYQNTRTGTGEFRYVKTQNNNGYFMVPLKKGKETEYSVSLPKSTIGNQRPLGLGFK